MEKTNSTCRRAHYGNFKPNCKSLKHLGFQWDTILRLFYRQAPIFQKQFLNLLLDKITDVTGKRYLVNISSQAGSHMQEMVASNTKASTVHVMQMTGIFKSLSSLRTFGAKKLCPRSCLSSFHFAGTIIPLRLDLFRMDTKSVSPLWKCTLMHFKVENLWSMWFLSNPSTWVCSAPFLEEF